ncbi:MAG TPA: TlpA disulfide reductase family protein [Chitinophagaceae bacterium]
MRKSFLLLLLAAGMLSADAQKSKIKAQITETTVVKDTSGNVIPAALWVPLYRSGKVKMRPINVAQDDSEFVLSRYTDEEWNKLMESMPRPHPSKAFKNNGRFGNFRERDLEGNLHNLKDLKGKVVVINFWFINCPPCRMEIPDLNELVAQYSHNKDVVFLGIALDDRYRLEEFLRIIPFRYHIIENGRNLAEGNNVKAFPTHVVLDREGKILFHTDGLARNTVYWVKKSIDKALAQPGNLAQGK